MGMKSVIAEPLGETSNCGVRSHNTFVCMYIYIIYIILYIYYIYIIYINYRRLDRLHNR